MRCDNCESVVHGSIPCSGCDGIFCYECSHSPGLCYKCYVEQRMTNAGSAKRIRAADYARSKKHSKSSMRREKPNISKEEIEAALAANGYNRYATAIQLGIGQTSLNNRIKEFGIVARRDRSPKSFEEKLGDAFSEAWNAFK